MNQEDDIYQPEIRVKSIKLENFRGFEQLELEFHPNLTVLIGANGSGKTAVLDGLASSLTLLMISIWVNNESALAPRLGPLDIKQGKFSFDIQNQLLLDGKLYTSNLPHDIYNNPIDTNTFRKISGESKYSNSPMAHMSEQISSRMYQTPINLNLPIIVYYSASNAPINFIDFNHARDYFKTHIFTTYEHALDKEAFNANYFFEWYRWQGNIEKQLGDNQVLDQVRDAIYSLLSDDHNQFDNLSINWLNNPSGEMLIQKNGTTLNINQLASGEKTLLALVADLARRLAIANPNRVNPLEGYGIVLIDEIDLHLHPRWQRHVIPRLQKIFPNCQLIVTTHSPLVLSEVRREHVIILEDFEAVKDTPHTFGRDNNSILSDIMGVSPRPEFMQKRINDCFNLIDRGELREAKDLLEELSKTVGSNDPDIVYGDSLIHFMDEE